MARGSSDQVMVGGRSVPVLRGLRVTLRPPAAFDADAVRRIGVYPEIERFFGEDAGAEWRERTQEEAETLLAGLAPSDDKVAWVVDAGSGFVGTARLHSFDGAAGTAAYAVGLLSPDVLGLGLGTEVTQLVLAHAFGDLKLSALTVRVLEFNSRAIACYARCGFVAERREPDAVLLGGIPYADVIMRLDAARYRRLPPGPRAAADSAGQS